ncbi:M50 family metallopeptidase [Methylobacterium isbiliense]|uniref:ATP-dependent zinc metalloprotease FtsH n=1 Tax=Methylobacterium isbiliense TaxID=315478 RepID=A0ABQ4SE30_9HYPH|nr:M50 family metallopeptidase [Methylobacterium isbiliense]MDN3625588.1 M50 family metallopeptidase [Methylobacterium isbiliense]GJE00024.1 hypothetical protein GMJLKIPL_1942 [Methylobacterium isbiliense]
MRLTAAHEAGHAVVAIALGRRIEQATIEAAGPHVAYTSPHEGDPSLTLMTALITSAAGPLAEGMALGRVRRPHPDELLQRLHQLEHGWCDLCRQARFVSLIPDLDDTQRVALWQAAYATADALLDRIEFRLAVARVAHALTERTTLDDAEVEALVDRATLRAAAADTIERTAP